MGRAVGRCQGMGGLRGPARATLTAQRGFIELKGEGGGRGALSHPQPGPLKRGARPGRGRGGPRDRGWKHSLKSCPGSGTGTSSLLAPSSPGGPPPPIPGPGRGGKRGTGGGAPSPSYPGVPASWAVVPPAPRLLAGSPPEGWRGLGRGTPGPTVLGCSGLQLVPLRHRLPGPGDHVLPVLHLPGAALPGQVDLRGQAALGPPSSAPGPSSPIPLPGTAAFTPKPPPSLPAPPTRATGPGLLGWRWALGAAVPVPPAMSPLGCQRRGRRHLCPAPGPPPPGVYLDYAAAFGAHRLCGER